MFLVASMRSASARSRMHSNASSETATTGRCLQDWLGSCRSWRTCTTHTSGRKRHWADFASLPEDAWQRLDSYTEANFAFPLLDPINSREARRAAEPAIGKWERRARKHRREEQPMEALRRDAEVLAAIEFANGHLRREAKKLVLVTGSSYLFAAARRTRPAAREAELRGVVSPPSAMLSGAPALLLGDGPSASGLRRGRVANLFFLTGPIPAMTRQGIVDRRVVRDIADGRNGSADRPGAMPGWG